ncbi:MAG: phosphoglycerate dehydrogenase [Bacteroidetes bacterium]|nr:phosphoglycerate dehydrogenase [Bacteroidota bacterium]
MKAKTNILIIDDLHPVFFEKINNEYFNVNYVPFAKVENIPELLNNCEVLILRSKTNVDAKLCNDANKLKLVARAGSGLDNLDLEWLQSKGIKVINTPEANRTSVAEQASGMLLALMANIVKGNIEVKSKVWDREGNRGEELSGKTLGIIGFGNTGSEFARVISGFGVKILAYDKYKSGFSNDIVQETEIEEIFFRADILSLHIPLTSETRKLVNSEFINKFKNPFRLMNTSRGEIVNTHDVIDALETGKIKGFATDVLENEKIGSFTKTQEDDFIKLCNMSNVIITPHVAGWTKESYRKISVVLAEKINEFFEILTEKSIKRKIKS